MIVAIHQPNYLPWAGFFYKMASCDRFVLLDTVPFSKNSYQNRCRIRSARGAQWLTVPVLTRGRFGQPTRLVEIQPESRWGEKHWRTLAQNYGKTAHWGALAERLEGVYARPWERLAELNAELIAHLAALLGIRRPAIEASSLDVAGTRSELLCAICRGYGATVYLSGPSGRRYLDVGVFRAAGIEVRFTDFIAPVYDQGPGDFLPGLSMVDMFCHCGPHSLALLRGAGAAGGGAG